MRDKEDALGRQTKGNSETSAGASISTAKIHDGPPTRKQPEVAWLFEHADCPSDRILTAWALHLRDIDPKSDCDRYLWREIAQLELRRRRRNGGAQ